MTTRTRTRHWWPVRRLLLAIACEAYTQGNMPTGCAVDQRDRQATVRILCDWALKGGGYFPPMCWPMQPLSGPAMSWEALTAHHRRGADAVPF
jgi:hypothetical protein